jgi:hypothetical protein
MIIAGRSAIIGCGLIVGLLAVQLAHSDENLHPADIGCNVTTGPATDAPPYAKQFAATRSDLTWRRCVWSAMGVLSLHFDAVPPIVRTKDGVCHSTRYEFVPEAVLARRRQPSAFTGPYTGPDIGTSLFMTPATGGTCPAFDSPWFAGVHGKVSDRELRAIFRIAKARNIHAVSFIQQQRPTFFGLLRHVRVHTDEMTPTGLSVDIKTSILFGWVINAGTEKGVYD